ncbi:MAG TPA: hypothetical protein V6D47_07285 [Oscillatoriaceae cyanobacterium]
MTALAAALALQLLVALVALGSMAGLGAWMLKALRIETEGVERLFYAVCLGMAGWIFYPMALGFLGLAFKPLLAVPLVGLLGIRELRLGRGEAARATFLGAVLSPLLWLTLYPPETSDDLSYHLPIAQSLLTHHRLVVDPWLQFPVLTFNGEMLFSYGLLISPTVAQVFPWVALVAVGWGCFAAGRRQGRGRTGGYLAFAMLLGNQLLLALATICYIDVQLGLYLTAGIFSLEHYLEQRERPWLTLAALMLAVAAGIKYTALVVVAVAFVFLLSRRAWRDVRHFGMVLALVASPWYLRNFWLTHNPLWPFVGKLLPLGPYWSAIDYQEMLLSYKRYVTETGWHGLMMLPWHLADTLAIPHHPITLWLWPGLALFVLSAFVLRRREYLAAFVAAFAVVAFCFVSLAVPRYDVPVVPILAVLAGCGYDFLLRPLPTRALRYVGILVVFVFALGGAGDYLRLRFSVQGRPPATAQGVERFMERHVPTYHAVKLARALPVRTYGLFLSEMYFYGGGKLIGDTFGAARYQDTLHLLGAPALLHHHLTDLECGYLLIDRPKLRRVLKNTPSPLPGLESSGYFKKIYEDSETVLYALQMPADLGDGAGTGPSRLESRSMP